MGLPPGLSDGVKFLLSFDKQGLLKYTNYIVIICIAMRTVVEEKRKGSVCVHVVCRNRRGLHYRSTRQLTGQEENTSSKTKLPLAQQYLIILSFKLHEPCTLESKSVVFNSEITRRQWKRRPQIPSHLDPSSLLHFPSIPPHPISRNRQPT